MERAPVECAKRRHRLREVLYRLRTEGGTPARQAAAVALGIFIGCTPLYGLHLPLCLLSARMLGLNRVKTYLAAHISTPVLMPFLLFFEVQTGRLVRGKPLLSIRPSQVPERWKWDAAHLSFWHWKSWGDLLIGSLALGAFLAGVLALLTFWLLRRGQRPAEVEALIEDTSHRYLDAGLMQCEAVRGKLRHDPVYFAILRQGDLPGTGQLIDLGCGRGIALALLAAARDQVERGVYPAGWPPPPALQLIGIEASSRTAKVARAGLGARASIETACLADSILPPIDAVLLLDVLHYLTPADQEQLLARASAALSRGGVLLLREANAAAGWRFQTVRLSERLMALLRRDWRQCSLGFHYRTQAAWLALLTDRGFTASLAPMGMGTPYANVLIRAIRS